MPPDLNSSTSAESHGAFNPVKGEDVEDGGLAPLPTHVNTVKDGLLDFNHFLTLEAIIRVLEAEKFDFDENTIPLSAYRTGSLKAPQRVREIEFLESAQKLALGAQRFEREFSQDSQWKRLFRSVMTSRADDDHYPGLVEPIRSLNYRKP